MIIETFFLEIFIIDKNVLHLKPELISDYVKINTGFVT